MLQIRRGLKNISKINYNNYLSPRSKLREPSAIRSLQPLLKIPGIISLGGGMPNSETFPIKEIYCKMKDGSTINICDEQNINDSLQYSSTQGLPKFIDQLETIQKKEHGYIEDRRICVTNGSQDGLSKAFDMLLDEKSTLLLEDTTYSGSIAYLRSLNCNLEGIQSDEFGMIPEDLNEKLDHWESKNPNKEKPKCIYIIPNCSNPTGITTTWERRKKIYDIALKHKILILEDDPYYYMQFELPRIQSFYSMDKYNGIVLRFDSFSKIVSSGIRIGFVTGVPYLIDKIELHSQSTVLHPSGISQSIVSSFLDHLENSLDNNIDDDRLYIGFNNYINHICRFYKIRRDKFIEKADKYLKETCEWKVPSGGMFVWIKIKNIKDSAKLINEKGVKEKIILVPGESFLIDNTKKSNFVRASYSSPKLDDFDEALKRLSKM
jgi:kynurenine/2-aminoadipate aminotransferase